MSAGMHVYLTVADVKLRRSSHASIPPETRRERGLPDDLVRISAGIEDEKDLIDDLARAFAEAAKLEQQIQNSESLKVDEDNFGDQWFFAGYDPPFRLSGRHNEVWVPVVEL